MAASDANIPVSGERAPITVSVLSRVSKWPWWLIIVIVLGIYIIYSIFTNEITNDAFWFILGQPRELDSLDELVLAGILMTLFITVVSYFIAVSLGLIVGLGRVSDNIIIFNLASFYVEVIRGIPMLVVIMATAFVGTAFFVDAVNALGEWLVNVGLTLAAPLVELSTRQISTTWRGIFALGIAYGAFSAEIFRAGIESIEKGQMEAARALGMSYIQAMRYIILPQAIRRVLPALGNDFVALLKDSSLISILGVRDMFQLNRLYINSTFNYVQGFAVLSFLYLSMTILLSRLVRLMEHRMSRSYR
ncbi:MAG: amino acid ABC transporter permease [Chloroflexota bacterium]